MLSTLILTGTCGSGKTTISTLLATQMGWKRISEDDIWHDYFGKNRGAFGTEKHRLKRKRVHETVFTHILSAHRAAKNVVIDATVHETPPEAYNEYRDFFEKHGIKWRICILNPRLEVVVARDSQRKDWVAGVERIEQLRTKFSGKVFNKEWFIDNSDDTPEQTMSRIIQSGAA